MLQLKRLVVAAARATLTAALPAAGAERTFVNVDVCTGDGVRAT